MAALISSVMDTKDKVPYYVAECADMGIEVLPPDVNSSRRDFAVVEGKIRFGLSAVKNVGENAVRAIVAGARRGRPVHVGVGLLRARRRAAGQQARARQPGQRGAFDSTGAHARRHARGARAGDRAGPQVAGRPARRPGLDLRPRRLRGRAAAASPAGRRARVRAQGAAGVRARDARAVPPDHPLAEVADELRRRVDCRCASCRTAASTRSCRSAA